MKLVESVYVFVAVFTAGVNGISSVDLGMTLAVRAYDLVCWYEKLRQFPNTDSSGFTRDCLGKAEHVKKQIKNDEMGRIYFGDWMIRLAMDGLPKEYGYACNDYLRDPEKVPSMYEGDALNDGQGGEPYPFQGFSYCLLTQLRQKFGNKAIEEVRNEKTHQRKHWMTAILDRQNEIRARHGSEPLLLIKELTDYAQEYAERLARECNLRGSSYTDRGRNWNGNATGESLAAGPAMPKEDAALTAANSWYEEMKKYPFPQGYTGNGQDMLYGQIGHFSQTVWRGTRYVGYGLAQNDNCDMHKWYLVARYAPVGNYIGEFSRNVGDPRDSYPQQQRQRQRVRYYEYYSRK